MHDSLSTPPEGFLLNSQISSTATSSLNVSDTPVLFMTFKRLEETKKSFKQIRRAAPKKFYISGDGPRPGNVDDEIKVKATREFVLNNIDWDCEVKTLLRDKNLGCREGVATAIDWFFENEEAGIIIEDDIVASDSFFRFATELLNYYRDDSRIMCITGLNHQDGVKRGQYSYYYSQLNHVWGWASWRSCWKEYRRVEKIIPQLIREIQSGDCPGFTHNEVANFMWQHNLIEAYNSVVDTWDYIWTFAVLINSGLTCIPNYNLVEHIGYGDDSAHIKQPLDFTILERKEIEFPLTHPPYIVYNKDADDYTYKKVFFIDNFKKALDNKKAHETQKRAQAASNESATQTSQNYQPSIFQNNGGVKVLIISSKDTGGAGGAARRMHEAVLRQGADSVMLVLDKQSNAPFVAQIEQPIQNLDKSQPSAQLFYAFNIIQTKLNNYPNRNNLEMFTTTESIVNYNELTPYIQQADVINVHWIDGFFDYYNAPTAFKGKQIVWTLHDMYQFTGGCHHAFECENYVTGCKGCPQMGESDNCEMTQNSLNIKMHAYKNLNISVTAPSEWLKECSEKSILMKGMETVVMPNIFDINEFKPVDQSEARKKLNLPEDKAIILFGSDSLLRPVKNLKTLITSLTELCNDQTINCDDFILVLFGGGTLGNIDTPYKILELGVLSSSEMMSYVYSAADFTAVPSLIESFSYLKCESLACGTPIVGFAVGGMPYLMENSITGYLAKPYDVDEFKSGLLWGLNTARNNTNVRSRCRKVIEDNLNEKLVAGNMIAFYKHVAAKESFDESPQNKSIKSNDPLRGRYINTLFNTDDNILAETASSFTTELCTWLSTTLLPHRNLTEEEAILKSESLAKLSQGSISDSEYLRYLLLSIVLTPAEELPLVIKIYNQPDYIKDLLTQYIFSFKEIPSHSGFTESTLKHMKCYLEMFQKEIAKNPQNASKLIMSAFNTLRKIPVYCANGGLRSVMELTGKMMKELLLNNNAAVDYTFSKRSKTGKIKLGILLQALSEHTETYATLPAFTNLNRDEYEIFVFVLKISHSSQELQYKDCYDHIIEISPTLIPQSVSKIREADLDIILIGTNITALANHNALISTHRLARVQAVHFCNPCTTGIQNVDYFITGNNFSLKEEDFTERLIFNKNSGVCFEADTVVKPASLELTRSSLGVPDNAVVFITGANYYKFTWELREFWARLLKEIPNSYLLTLPFGPAWTNKYPVNEFNISIHKQLSDSGVDPDRLVIIKPLPTREDVRRAVGLCDIYLDSFPYSGATSLLDPLHTSIPIVCMKTDSIRGGQGSGMLEDVGLTDLIVHSKDEYLTLSKRLANDKEYREEVSTKIKNTMSNNPVFLNTKDYCADMDRIYKAMLIEYDNNQSDNNTKQHNTILPRLKPNDICSCGSGLKYKKCCGK